MSKKKHKPMVVIDSAVVNKLVDAAEEAIKQWRKQVRLAKEMAGEIAVNEGNGVAFVQLTAAISSVRTAIDIAKAEGQA